MRGPDDRQQRASRLRIGGWLSNTTPASATPPPGLPARADNPADPPPESPDLPPATHRRPTSPRWLAAAAIITVLFSAGVIVSLSASRGTDPPVAIAPSPVPSPAASTAPASYIPAPTPTSASPAPTTPTRTASRSRTAPPAPVAPSVTVATTAVPDLVDLAEEGTLDWIHWGLSNAGSLNRKRDGSGAIRDLGGARGRYNNNPQRFTWTGGTPSSSSSGTPTGVYACGVGSGFSLRVAAGSRPRTLHFYAGLWKARGRLTVTLSSATATATLENRQDITTARFVIRFQAPPGSTLSITWTTTETFDPTCGNVDMQAATLA